MRILRILLVWLLALPPAYADRWWVGGGSANTWAATAPTNWATSSGGANNAAVPTSADCVLFDANSGSGTSVISATITVNCVTATGYTGNITLNASQVLDIELGLVFPATMTFTSTAASSVIQFIGSTAGQTINTGGLTMPGMTLNGTGGWTLTGPLTLANASSFSVTKGTFNSGNFNITAGAFVSSSVNVRSVTLGTSTLTLNATSGTPWSTATITNLTFSGANSTMIVNDAATGAKTFAGGGLTYGNVSVTPGGTGAVTFSGANTFNTLTFTGPKSVIFTSSVTQTATAFSFTGTSGNLVTITASSSGTAADLSQASGTVCANFVSLKDSAAAGGASFFAANSTNVSGNSGWTFSACPSAISIQGYIIIQ